MEKSEAPNPKYETISNVKNKFSKLKHLTMWVFIFGISSSEI
jgi:hypothetical protein